MPLVTASARAMLQSARVSTDPGTAQGCGALEEQTTAKMQFELHLWAAGLLQHIHTAVHSHCETHHACHVAQAEQQPYQDA